MSVIGTDVHIPMGRNYEFVESVVTGDASGGEMAVGFHLTPKSIIEDIMFGFYSSATTGGPFAVSIYVLKGSKTINVAQFTLTATAAGAMWPSTTTIIDQIRQIWNGLDTTVGEPSIYIRGANTNGQVMTMNGIIRYRDTDPANIIGRGKPLSRQI